LKIISGGSRSNSPQSLT